MTEDKSMTDEQYKKLSINEFTKAAAKYEGNHAGIYEMCKKDYPEILEELEQEPFQDLLDAGCGPAPMISLLAEKYPDRHYTGLDLTPAMIEQAKLKHIPNAVFVVADCENFPFEENAFDAIICSSSFHHYPNPQAFFNSVKRCLRPGGEYGKIRSSNIETAKHLDFSKTVERQDNFQEHSPRVI